MQVFEVRVRIDEKADLVWPVTVTPRGSAEQVTGAPGSQAPGGKRMAREITHGNRTFSDQSCDGLQMVKWGRFIWGVL